MGTLVALKYRTPLFLKLFDHTYVQCGTGAVRWKCWGGDTGGTQFKSSAGSTIRAGKIAGTDANAGIQCYLINGVCHQAANRILSSAEITVQGARGYWVSTSLYGVYGRPFGAGQTCPSPFDQYPEVTGDLPECAAHSSEVAPASDDATPEHARFISRVLALYSNASGKSASTNLEQAKKLQLALFSEVVRYRLGESFATARAQNGLMILRESVEDARVPLDLAICDRAIDTDTFVEAYNNLAVGFQENVRALLGPEQYTMLFDLGADETVEIGDPKIAREAYGPSGSSGGGMTAGA